MTDEQTDSYLAGVVQDRAEHERARDRALTDNDDAEFARREANIAHCNEELKSHRRGRQKRS